MAFYRYIWWGTFVAFCVVAQTFAAGPSAFGNESLSARSFGEGTVGIAAENDDPTAVYANPAGMTHLRGTHITFGGTWENLHGSYETDMGVVSKMRSIDALVPNFAATQGYLDGKLAAGLGLLSPYGLETHWPGNGPLRYNATNSRLHLVVVTSALAYKIYPTVSVGIGADYVNAFDAALEKQISNDDINGTPVGSTPDGTIKLSGTDANWGYHAGVAFQPNEQHSFGLVYHSKVKLNIQGTLSITGLSGSAASIFGGTNYNIGSSVVLYLPQNIQFGYAFKPNKEWTLEADAAWYDWFSDRDLNVQYAESDPTRLGILTNNGAGNPIPLRFRDAWSFATGANYKYNERLQLRSGFFYAPWAEPESAFAPDLTDLTRYGVGVGVGYAFTKDLTMDLAYNAVFFHNRHVTNTVGVDTTGDPTFDASGLYKNFANVVALNLTYRFIAL